MPQNKNPLLNSVYFGLDMLEFNVGKLSKDFLLYDELVWNLDTDNSNIAYIEIFGLIFSYKNINISGFGDGLIFETSIDGIPVSCFSLLKGAKMPTGKGHSKDKVVLYSSFFVLQAINKIDFTLKEFVGQLFNYNNALLYRLDICNDVPHTIKDLSPVFIDIKKPSSAIGTDKKNPEFYQTYYIGEIQSSQNRHQLIRIYDKILDTWKKHKAFLYPHLTNNNDVRRIELELRPEQAKYYHNYCILDLLDNKNDVLSSIFAKYINKRIPEKYHLKTGDLKLITFSKRKFNLKNAFLDYGHIPASYLKHSYGYVKKVFQNTGYNGLFQLLFNQEHIDIFLQKNIKSCVGNILENKQYNLCLDHKGATNKNTNINNGYELLDHLIPYLKKNGLQTQKINKILKSHLEKPKIKLKPGKKH